MSAGGPVPDIVRIVTGPVWLLPQDAFTGRPPELPFTALVERRLDSGEWVPEDGVPVVRTPGGALVLPSLASRHPAPVPAAVRRLRVRLVSPYLLDAEHPDGVGFDAPSWTVPGATRIRLYPLPAYPFPPGTRLLRGRVRRVGGTAVAGATVVGRARTDGGHLPRIPEWAEYAATAGDGSFRLPLRRVGSKSPPPPDSGGPDDPEAEWFTVTARADTGEASVHPTARTVRDSDQLIEIP
ncbi:hypothetical protein ACWD25_38325 [Streptomyces sp. NPDC002920]